MKINVFLGAVAAMLLLLSPSVSARSEAGRKISPSKLVITDRRTSAMNFTKIEVSRAVKLVVEDRTDDVIVVRANENVMPYVELSVKNGRLKASLSGDLNMSSISNNLVVEVSIPNNGRIDDVRVSGASSVTIVPRVQGQSFYAEVSGASSLTADIAASRCSIEVSGASSAKFSYDGGQLSLDVSGASAAKGTVNALKSAIEVSGASAAHIDGKSESSVVEVSGASAFKGSNFETSVCTAEVSGVSAAEVCCSESLSADASGMSKIVYSGECRLSSVSTSGAGSIRKK